MGTPRHIPKNGTQRQENAALRVRQVDLCIFSHFSLFLLFGITEIYPQVVYFAPKFLNLAKMTCIRFFSELTLHTTKEINSGKYQVGAMLWYIMYLLSFIDTLGIFQRVMLVQGSRFMCIEVVYYKNNFFRVRIYDIQQILDRKRH